MKNVILAHASRYPEMQVQDYIKLIYQSEFGGSHFVADEAEALAHLREECAALPKATLHERTPFEPVGCGMERLYLSRTLLEHVSMHTINRMAILSANAKHGSLMHFKQKLNVLRALSEAGEIPPAADVLDEYLSEYEASGYPSVHHTDEYRAAYHPVYRLVTRRFRQCWYVIELIESLMKTRTSRIILAIDGPAAAGKSTLSALLASLYDCNVFHMDDFFLPFALRTEETANTPGGNMDFARFRREVGGKMRRNSPFVYHRYDCRRNSLGETVYVTPKRLNIVEGSYSMHPDLADLYDGAVFVTIDAETQRARVITRNQPSTAKRYLEEWIPRENEYFDACGVEERCTVTLRTDL